jgi:hypothetical protein
MTTEVLRRCAELAMEAASPYKMAGNYNGTWL